MKYRINLPNYILRISKAAWAFNALAILLLVHTSWATNKSQTPKKQLTDRTSSFVYAKANFQLQPSSGLQSIQFSEPLDTTENIFTFVEQMPFFPGGESAQNSFIRKNLRYPAEAIKAGVTGLVVVQFVVNKKGKIQDIRVIKGISKELDEEVMRIVKLMPDFAPAQQKGQPVSFRYTLPVRFSLASPMLPDAEPDTLRARIFTFTENPPQFPGGESALQIFIQNNLNLPSAGIKTNTQKYVLVQFILDVNGKLFYPKVISSANKEMDEEAIRVVKLLPAFIPAKQSGQAVPFKYTLPVRFYK